MYSDASADAKSPATGISPMIGSRPKRQPTPGTSNTVSDQTLINFARLVLSIQTPGPRSWSSVSSSPSTADRVAESGGSLESMHALAAGRIYYALPGSGLLKAKRENCDTWRAIRVAYLPRHGKN